MMWSNHLTLYWLHGYSHPILNCLSLLNWFQKSDSLFNVFFYRFLNFAFWPQFCTFKDLARQMYWLLVFLQVFWLFLLVHFSDELVLVFMLSIHISIWGSVQSISWVRLFAIPWTAAHQASLSVTNSQSLLKLMSIESVMPSNYLILCCPFILPPSIFPSIRIFSNESVLSHQVAKVLEIHLQHQSFQWIFSTDLL